METTCYIILPWNNTVTASHYAAKYDLVTERQTHHLMGFTGTRDNLIAFCNDLAPNTGDCEMALANIKPIICDYIGAMI